MSYPAKIVVADLNADDSSALNALLSTVFSNSRTEAFFAGLGLSSSVTVYLTQGAWIAGGSVLTSVGDRTQVDQQQMPSAAIQNLVEHSGQYVLLNLDADATGYVFGVDGWRHQDTAERTLIHELTHALTIPSMINPNGAGGLDNEAYREQIAVFAANAVFGNTRSPERQGHVSADYQWAGQIFQGSSASQTSYIDGTEQISFGWSPRSRYSAEFHTVDSLGSTTRTYWRGISLGGGPVSNYITTERDLDPGNQMFEHRSYGFGFYVEQKTAAIIEGSIIAGGREAAERAYNAARAACIDLQDWQSPFNLAIGGFAGGGTLADTFAGLSHGQTRLVTVAAERFQMDGDIGSLDRSGPMIGSSQLNTFYVDDSHSMRGRISSAGQATIASRSTSPRATTASTEAAPAT